MLRLSFVLCGVLLAAGCQKSAAPMAVDAGSAPRASSSHESMLPFDTGPNPKIEDLPVEDWRAFLSGTSWCTRTAQGRLSFAADGGWTRNEESGRWSVEGTKLVLSLAGLDSGVRTVDAQAGKVNGRTVLSLDGRMYAACE